MTTPLGVPQEHATASAGSPIGNCPGRQTSAVTYRRRCPVTPPFLLPLIRAMCHNVHMKTISIRELHLNTGRWVRHAASRGPIVVTDRGRRVAALQPFDASVTGRP